MKAKYNGKCRQCFRPISKGDSITLFWGKTIHKSCLEPIPTKKP